MEKIFILVDDFVGEQKYELKSFYKIRDFKIEDRIFFKCVKMVMKEIKGKGKFILKWKKKVQVEEEFEILYLIG